MKFFRIAIYLLVIFILFSCRESFVKTKDTVPVKGVPEPNEEKVDSINLFKKNPEEREKTKFKQNLDTLKPKLALSGDSIPSSF
ncbi:hypothetical protein [Maribacter aestuarii]|uniref:hypothetical protein n=1 Tax=Maribacter aestuarii TaxID=1130723 RepID=UPI0025A5A4C7|nr:hypothetical protein [Maribacter aestuarii]